MLQVSFYIVFVVTGVAVSANRHGTESFMKS